MDSTRLVGFCLAGTAYVLMWQLFAPHSHVTVQTTSMLDHPIRSTTATVDIYIKLAQYPILSDAIRKRMRQALYERGVLTEDAFEQEVEERATESQKREGLFSPYHPESYTVWEERGARRRRDGPHSHRRYRGRKTRRRTCAHRS